MGAFTAGIAIAVADDSLAVRQDRNALAGILFGFSIPVYFALIGLQLDLIHHFNPLFFFGLLVFACMPRPPASTSEPGYPARTGSHRGAWRSR